MKTILAGVGLSILLAACATDNAPSASVQATTNLLMSSAGVYKGAFSTRVPITLLTLYDGTAYLFYQVPVAGVIVVSNGKQADDGQFKGVTSTQYSLRPVAGASPVQVRIDFSRAPTVSGVVEGSGSQMTFSASPDVMLGQGPSLATLAGEYRGRVSSLQGGANGQILIAKDGLMAGTTSTGCEFRGSVSPNSGVVAYNASVTFSSAPCSTPNATLTGHAVLKQGRLLIALPTQDRSDIVVFEGAK